MTRAEYRYKVDNGTGCWLWSGALNRQGYGTAFGGRDKRLAHRFMYELHIGPIPTGLELDHLCSQPACVNPAHLEPVTHAENMRRSRAGAYWAAKTHCPHGHAYDAENTRHFEGRRWCRTCRQQQSQRRRAA